MGCQIFSQFLFWLFQSPAAIDILQNRSALVQLPAKDILDRHTLPLTRCIFYIQKIFLRSRLREDKILVTVFLQRFFFCLNLYLHPIIFIRTWIWRFCIAVFLQPGTIFQAVCVCLSIIQFNCLPSRLYRNLYLGLIRFIVQAEHSRP